jgi:outer membrane murein-binding lipoprotein Lpp
MNRVLLIGFCLTVGVAIVAGLWVVGGPNYARMVEQDRQRVFDLNALADQIVCAGDPAWHAPESLAEMTPCRGHQRANLHDPVTKEPYHYTKLNLNSFEVCAELAIDPETPRRILAFKNDLILRGGNIVCIARHEDDTQSD